MKKSINIVLVVLITLFFIQCKTTTSALSIEQENKSIYIAQFKLTYLRQLLRVGFNHSDEIEKIILADRSGYHEPILEESDYLFIDSLIYAENKKLVADSIARIGKVSEGNEGKHLFSFLLNQLENKQLDSIAKKRYRLSKQ